MRNPKIGVVSLGCPKNTTDTEVMLGLLNQAGFQVTFNNDEADMCLVNTCSFIQEARRESVQALVELASQGKEIIIAGCLAQHFKEELLAELPEAHAVIGTGDIHKIVEVVQKVASNSSLRVIEVSETPNDHSQLVQPRTLTNMGTSAYLKIAEGCNHKCTFCIIPLLRGKFRSRTIESLVKEAQILVKAGVGELILVSQDSTYYGLDIYHRFALGELLQHLHEIDGLEWIRIMYFYPTEATDSLLETMANLPKVVKYVDIPLQHSHPQILHAMGRPQNPAQVISRIRAIIPSVAIRSTFIVGFPGESEEHIEHLAQFVEQQRFDRLGVFSYSRQMEVESGHMNNQIPERIKKKRRKRIMEIQHNISLARNKSLIGQSIEALIESYDESQLMYVGRSQWDAPDVDNLVYVKAPVNDDVLIGSIQKVLIEEAKPYDLVGSLMEAHPARNTANPLPISANPPKLIHLRD